MKWRTVTSERARNVQNQVRGNPFRIRFRHGRTSEIRSPRNSTPGPLVSKQEHRIVERIALSPIRVEQALSLCIQGCACQSNAVINLKLCQFDWLEKLINELVDNLLRSRRHLPSLLCSSRERFTLSMIDKEFSAPLGDFSTAYSDSGGSALLAE